MRDLRFRDQFNAAVVAVARKGERIRSKPGDILLQSGDILLLDTGSSFAPQNKVCGPAESSSRVPRSACLQHPPMQRCPTHRPLPSLPTTPALQDSKHFSIIIEMPDTNPPRYLHTAIAIFSIAAAFILYATEVLDILPGAAIVVAIMLLTGCMSPDQARRAIRWVSGLRKFARVGRLAGFALLLLLRLLLRLHLPASPTSSQRERQPCDAALRCCPGFPPTHLHCRTSIS